jgi:hypothetical protein
MHPPATQGWVCCCRDPGPICIGLISSSAAPISRTYAGGRRIWRHIETTAPKATPALFTMRSSAPRAYRLMASKATCPAAAAAVHACDAAAQCRRKQACCGSVCVLRRGRDST